jgi:hypothetical protein
MSEALLEAGRRDEAMAAIREANVHQLRACRLETAIPGKPVVVEWTLL